ncbi:MAG: HlyD family efflux transporter periplasmic adaptor subunit [Blastocatellia bacterium]
MKTDYCAYPPQIAADVEINEQRDGDQPAFIIGSAAVGRYLLLRAVEYRVLQLLGAGLTPAAVCDEFRRRHGGTLRLTTLTRFLTRLDEIGILAGERVEGHHPQEQQLSTQFYTRFKLFNPDPLFARLVGVLGWVWTMPFFVVSLLLMLTGALLALMNGDELAHYGGYVLREHYVAVIVAGLLVGVTHEFAHGLTCKAFGGRANEVGVLMIYYFLPALYCNVSGIHLMPQRRQRLWVIAAGVYWQMLVGTLALLAWLMLAPYTLLADLAFIFFCGSVMDVAFNGNPLIKLDGYYFLSQSLRLPNLMDRAREWWRGCLRRIVFGEPNEAAARFSRREQTIFAAFGLLSFVYAAALRLFIVIFLGSYLIDWFHLPGLLGAIALALFYARRPLGQLIAAAVSASRTMAADFNRFLFTGTETNMATQDQNPQALSSADSGESSAGPGPSRRRRRLVPLAIALFIVMILCLPWNASVGAYGTLVAVPGQEAIIRAPESATLVELSVRPGDLTDGGAVIGRMSNIELEEQLAETQTELDRANADYDRLLGELRAHGESIVRAEVSLRQRQTDYDESNSERRQIGEREGAEPKTENLKYLTASIAPTGAPTGAPAGRPVMPPAAAYPAAIAVLQSDADLRQARLSEAGLHLDRTRRLYAQNIVPRSELDGAETRASTLTIELTAARNRLEAALVEHRRRHVSLATEMQLAHSDVAVGRLQAGKLEGELRSARALISTLTSRHNLLRRRLAQFEIVTPRPGAVFGAELPRLAGQFFPKGAEICRVADTRRLLARIQAPEREIGDVRVGHPVRLKVSAYPDHVFRGKVVKIGGESETDQNGRVSYRVELVIENTDELLRPGMTAFARIDAGRQMIVRILLHKLKQAMRPELWII